MKIAAVVVTFNRLEKLKKTLEYYESQERKVDDLVVVDNASTDGTKAFLEKWVKEQSASKHHVIYMKENLGGSGGFHDGCEYALTLNPDWILVGDDDAYPDKELILKFITYINNNNCGTISSICSTVLNMDGTIAYHHRRSSKLKYYCKMQILNSSFEDYQKDFFYINEFSYVGTFLKVKSLREVGLCNKDFFIYYDDNEHAIRMAKTGRIVCVPSLKFYHDDGFTSEMKSSGQLPLWRSYYYYRNSLYTLLHFYPIVGLCRILSLFVKGKLTHMGSKDEIKMRQTAVKDALLCKLGKHYFYRP